MTSQSGMSGSVKCILLNDSYEKQTHSAPRYPVATSVCVIHKWLFSIQSFYSSSSWLCHRLPITAGTEKFFLSPPAIQTVTFVSPGFPFWTCGSCHKCSLSLLFIKAKGVRDGSVLEKCSPASLQGARPLTKLQQVITWVGITDLYEFNT